MKTALMEQDLNPLGQSVLQTLLYFDVFSYPLTLQEIHAFLGKSVPSRELLHDEIAILLEKRLIFRFGEFYSIPNDERKIERRIKGNREAERFIPMAKEKAELIGRFPFVRGVMASGSLSKGYMDEKSDLDFFVVTEPRRLWIARTLFVLYRKVFVPQRRHKEFCANYFITSDHLEIEEKNIFTATELATLIPLVDGETHRKVISANTWMLKFLPNFRLNEDIPAVLPREGPLKTFTENLLSILWAARIDRFLMNITLRRFKQKYGAAFAASDFSLAFKTAPHVSKAHLGNNQKRVLRLLQEKTAGFHAKSAHA